MRKILKISQQTLWQIIAKIITALATFSILGLVARNYGEEGTGIFTLTTTYLGIFYLLADFGFNAYILSRADKVENEWNKLLGTRLVWALFLIVVALVVFPILPFATPFLFAAIIFGSLDILASAIFVTNNLIFQSKLRYDFVTKATLVGTTTGLILFLVVLTFKPTVPVLLLAFLSGGVIIAPTSTYLVKQFVSKVKPVFDITYTKELFIKSWPIAVTLALNVVYFRIDAFLVSGYRGLSDAGVYNLAYQVFQTILVLPTFVMNAYYPLMLQSLKENLIKFEQQLKWGFITLLIMALIGTAVVYISAPLIIEIISGQGFDGSVKVLRILSFSFPAYFLSSLLMWVMVARKKTKIMVLIYLTGLFFNLAANLIFIPQYSYIAASWITGLSEYLILLLQLLVLRRLSAV